MSQLKLTISDTNAWIPGDFASYFYGRCDDVYGNTTFDRNYIKDCPIMRRIIDKFIENSRPPLSVVHFIDWAIDRFEQKKLPPPLTIELMTSWVPTFLQIPFKKPKKVYNHLTEVSLTPEQKKWIREKRKAYKKGDTIFTETKSTKRPRKKRRKLLKGEISHET